MKPDLLFFQKMGIHYIVNQAITCFPEPDWDDIHALIIFKNDIVEDPIQQQHIGKI